MNDMPIMMASDEERVRTPKMSDGQKRSMSVMTAIQVALILLVYLLILLQAVTSMGFGIGAAPIFVVYMVVYLNFMKGAMMLSDEGIKVKWISAVKVLSPIFLVIGCIICLCTML